MNRKEYEQALAEWEEAMVKYEADMKLWEQQDYYYKERYEEYQKRGVPMPWYLDTPPGPPPVKPAPPTRTNNESWERYCKQQRRLGKPINYNYFPGQPPSPPLKPTLHSSSSKITFSLVFWGIIKLLTLLSALAIVLFGLFMFIAMFSSPQEALIWTGAALIGIIIAAIIIFRKTF